MASQNDSDAFLIRQVIQEVMRSVEIPPALDVIPERFNQLKKMLDIFQPHVLQDAAQGILSPTSRKLFRVNTASIVKGRLQFAYTPLDNQENSKYPIELYSNDLVLITSKQHAKEEVKDLLFGQFRFAIVTTIPKNQKLKLKSPDDRGYYAQLEFIESGQSNDLDVHDVLDILNRSSRLDVLTTMVPFIRVFKSLRDAGMHEYSPLLDIILTNSQGNIWNPADGKTIQLLMEDPHYIELNPSQKEVTNHVIFAMQTKADLTLIQGPPGTGKTFSTCVMIYNAIRYLKGNGPIVVCAPSNVAVARIANKFVEMYCATDILDLQHIAILGREDKMDNGKTLSHLAFNRFYGTDPTKKKNREWHKVKCQMKIIFCTVSCVMSSRMDELEYSHVYCDEAGQVDEANALMLVQNSVKQLVMIGDPCQLPPFTLIKDAKNLHSNRSLFERFWDLKHSCCKMLNIQYRMDPIISKMVSDFMYSGKLQNGDNVSKYRFDFEYPFKTLEFINVNGCEERCNPSFKNEREAQKIVRMINQILVKYRLKNRDSNAIPPSIGVITGYAAQRDRIRLLLNNKDEDIQIDTFDSFQGQEKDIIILSLVRTAGIGFNKDRNRTNVAISRAKKSLLIVGKHSNFAKAKPWKGIIKYIEGIDKINSKNKKKPKSIPIVKPIMTQVPIEQPQLLKEATTYKNRACEGPKSNLLPWIDAHLKKYDISLSPDQIYTKKLRILQIKKLEHGLTKHVHMILIIIIELLPSHLWDTGFRARITDYISLLRNSQSNEIPRAIDTWFRTFKGAVRSSVITSSKEIPIIYEKSNSIMSRREQCERDKLLRQRETWELRTIELKKQQERREQSERDKRLYKEQQRLKEQRRAQDERYIKQMEEERIDDLEKKQQELFVRVQEEQRRILRQKQSECVIL